MSYFLNLAFTYLSLYRNTTQSRSTPTIDFFQEILLSKYEKYINNKYQNYNQNIILTSVFQAIKRQKKFTNSVIEEFANIFTKKTIKLIEVIKARKEKSKAISPQLLVPLNEIKF